VPSKSTPIHPLRCCAGLMPTGNVAIVYDITVSLMYGVVRLLAEALFPVGIE